MYKNKKINILFVHHGSGIGGAPISLLNLIKQLDKDKFNFKVVVFNDSEVVSFFKDNFIDVEVFFGENRWFSHSEPGKLGFNFVLKYYRDYRAWRKIAIKEGPEFLSNQNFDIIHLNSHVLSSYAYAAKSLNKKVVLHNREAIAKGYFGIRKRILSTLIDKYCDLIINISLDNSNRLGLEHKSSIVYNFVTLPSVFKEPFSRPKFKVLYLGGNALIKGFSTAVECLPFLDENVELHFAGNYNKWHIATSFKVKLKNVIKMTFYRSKYLPLRNMLEAKNARYLGLLRDPYPIIDDCDILITPFSVEHFSRPAMEAFAYGKPVIGSNVEGMNEIIDHNVNGLLFEKNNPKALADAINYLARNPSIGKEMGQKAREKAVDVFSPDINAKKVESIYNMLIEEKLTKK